MKSDLLEGLTEEQIAKVKACHDNKEIISLAKDEGIELTEEQLEAINGGCSSGTARKCPKCDSTNVVLSPGTKGKTVNGFQVTYYRCKDCGNVFYVI